MVNGGGSLSMSMASPVRGGGRRCGEAVMSSALRVVVPGKVVEQGGGSVGGFMTEGPSRCYRKMGWVGCRRLVVCA